MKFRFLVVYSRKFTSTRKWDALWGNNRDKEKEAIQIMMFKVIFVVELSEVKRVE